MFVLITLLNVT